MEEPSLKRVFYGAVTVGERGQVVVPAEARKASRMEPGDKLLVFGHPLGLGLFLTKVDNVQAVLAELAQHVANMNDNADESGQGGDRS
jgi:AbrB family looped-hinge helix DNA binding protein